MIAKSMLLDPRKKQVSHEEPLKYRETYEQIIQELIPFQTPTIHKDHTIKTMRQTCYLVSS